MTVDIMILLACGVGILLTPLVLLLWNETFEHLQSLTPREEPDPWSPFNDVKAYWNLVPWVDKDLIPEGLHR